MNTGYTKLKYEATEQFLTWGAPQLFIGTVMCITAASARLSSHEQAMTFYRWESCVRLSNALAAVTIIQGAMAVLCCKLGRQIPADIFDIRQCEFCLMCIGAFEATLIITNFVITLLFVSEGTNNMTSMTLGYVILVLTGLAFICCMSIVFIGPVTYDDFEVTNTNYVLLPIMVPADQTTRIQELQIQNLLLEQQILQHQLNKQGPHHHMKNE